jgi:hypothetical protein
MIRPARPQDVPAIVRLGMAALNESPYPTLRISEAKVIEVAKACVSSPQHFAWVAEVEGEVRGAVTAFVDDCLFYERKQANVVQFYAREAPGEGIKMIRELMRWARARPVIKMVCFTLEVSADPRIGKLLSRMGLKAELPVYVGFT